MINLQLYNKWYLFKKPHSSREQRCRCLTMKPYLAEETGYQCLYPMQFFSSNASAAAILFPGFGVICSNRYLNSRYNCDKINTVK